MILLPWSVVILLAVLALLGLLLGGALAYIAIDETVKNRHKPTPAAGYGSFSYGLTKIPEKCKCKMPLIRTTRHSGGSIVVYMQCPMWGPGDPTSHFREVTGVE